MPGSEAQRRVLAFDRRGDVLRYNADQTYGNTVDGGRPGGKRRLCNLVRRRTKAQGYATYVVPRILHGIASGQTAAHAEDERQSDCHSGDPGDLE